MSEIRIKSISVKNYRSFKDELFFQFPDESYKKPVAIIGYNNVGKTNLMNSIKFGLYESVREDTFEKKDFYNCDWNNPPKFELKFNADINDVHILAGVEYTNFSEIIVENSKIIKANDFCNCYNNSGYSKKWVIKQNAPIFYINFHKIKDEISTQKTSWGNLKSFLAKHIKKLVDNDKIMKSKKDKFKNAIDQNTKWILKKSKLDEFIKSIKNNYVKNLRDNNFEVDFSLPEYEDIFLQMLFKIGLNGDKQNLVPIDHFGDGFISMFVMAVIKAIAETNSNDKCLFLFEEPESFLHENHQEYFYKMVLCELSKKHQVIYTTHSAKMLDIFDTRGIIRLETGNNNETLKKYNDIDEKAEIVVFKQYNSFIKNIEPNLNKILFSKKVILVEGPNDLMVYKYCIEKKVEEYVENKTEEEKKKYAETFLNFENISIIPHHGKSTALCLIEVCKHFGIDYFVINDWDFEESELSFDNLSSFETLEEMKKDSIYTDFDSNKKGMITNNFNLIKNAEQDKIHFNVKKLENVIGYKPNDKNSLEIWKRINEDNFEITEKLFPESLEKFLGLDKLEKKDEDEIKKEENIKFNNEYRKDDEVPF